MVPHLFIADWDYPYPDTDEVSVNTPTGFLNGAFKTQMGVRLALGLGLRLRFHCTD